MDAFWQYWNNLTPTLREAINAGIIGGVAVTVIAGVSKMLGVSLLAGARGVLRAAARRMLRGEPQAEPTSLPAPQTLVVKVESSQPPPLLVPSPKVDNAASPSPISLIPRPPVIGFVARRDAEGSDIVERLREELAPERNQLVTLSGPGGVGKTTLAAQAARELKEVFEGRVVWSDASARASYTLSTLLDDVATQLGRAEEIRTLAPEAKEEAVRTLVTTMSSLIILDNYETIADNEQQRIESWFERTSCPALLTSRPKVAKTCNITIAAMLPDEAQEFLRKLIAQTQAAQMFSVEIRKRIYETAEANPFLMEWIVAQIDAAQEPRTVLEELEQGEGEAAQRVFDRSFNLAQLGEDGRMTLLALSLFVPSASRPALAEVSGFGNDERRVNEAIKNLHALWLIKGIDENSRFTIEGLTRSLTKSRRLKDPHAAEFGQRFVAHFLRYAEAHAKTTPEDFAALKAEKDNILSAMDVAFNLNDWLSVTQLSDSVYNLLTMHGYWDEAIRRGEQAIESARKLPDESAIARFAHNTAITFQNRGELDEARRLYGESLEIEKRLGNQSGIAITLHELGRLAQAQGELDKARQLYDESLKINKSLGNQSTIASTLHQLAMLTHNQGELEEARRLYDESLEIKKKLGDQNGIAITLHELGRLAQAQGELDKARQLYDESLEIEKKIGNQIIIAITLHELGRLAQAQGELDKARRLYDESLEIEKRLGNQNGIAISLWQLGLFAGKEGDREEATRLLRESLSIFERLKSPNAERVRRNLARLEGESS